MVTAIDGPTKEVTVELPARSLNTYVFMIDQGSTAIKECGQQKMADAPKVYYDLHGRRLNNPRGLCIEVSADGSTRKVWM